MVPQYKTLSMCTSHIRKCCIPDVEVLKLEIRLCQAKRLLLDERVSCMMEGDIFSEKMFADMYADINDVLWYSGYDKGGLDKLTKKLDSIINTIENLLQQKILRAQISASNLIRTSSGSVSDCSADLACDLPGTVGRKAIR